MSKEGRVSRRDLFGLGLGRARERFDQQAAELPATPPPEPPWDVWDARPPQGSERFTHAAAESLVRACGVNAGERVLDWGCGQGEVALAAARLGARVTAVDFSSAPLERGRALAHAELLDIEWVERNGMDSGLEKASFDRSLSGFGLIWARDVPAAVGQLLRLTRPGGTVGFTTWVNRGFMGALLRLAREAGVLAAESSPSAWGREERLRQEIEHVVAELAVRPGALELDLRSDVALWDFIAQSAAPVGRGRDALGDEVRKLADGEADGAGLVTARFLEVVGQLPSGA